MHLYLKMHLILVLENKSMHLYSNITKIIKKIHAFIFEHKILWTNLFEHIENTLLTYNIVNKTDIPLYLNEASPSDKLQGVIRPLTL